MASRGAGTLLTEFSTAYVSPALIPGYQGHVPTVAFSFGAPYGTTTLKYFQDHRNAAMKGGQGALDRGSCLPSFADHPAAALLSRPSTWERMYNVPAHARFNLDSERSAELTHFYHMAQQHRKYYRDKTGTVPLVPFFVLPVKERDRYPIPTDLPPLSPTNKWHLFRVSPDNLKTYQTFPSGKRVSPQERQRRDTYFEFRA
ncbi:protein FAM166C [Perognathus longimembris pacificus]|uniref:protein FAM166C n=1 Tax=Perognathus longimembris pacificus TaxID=214514 RepID=UPI002019010A|nr:protein FAM166C [Perognathus longimembris pacificus]